VTIHSESKCYSDVSELENISPRLLFVRATLLGSTGNSKMNWWDSIHRGIIEAGDAALIVLFVRLHACVLLDPTEIIASVWQKPPGYDSKVLTSR
jgi:hypothetical protein